MRAGEWVAIATTLGGLVVTVVVSINMIKWEAVIAVRRRRHLRPPKVGWPFLIGLWVVLALISVIMLTLGEP